VGATRKRGHAFAISPLRWAGGQLIRGARGKGTVGRWKNGRGTAVASGRKKVHPAGEGLGGSNEEGEWGGKCQESGAKVVCSSDQMKKVAAKVYKGRELFKKHQRESRSSMPQQREARREKTVGAGVVVNSY